MTKQAIDFNLRYDLNVTPSSFEAVKAKNISNELSGRPKKNITQVIKRFFQNPVAVAALIAFVAILVLSIVLPMVSQYSDSENIGHYTKVGITDIIKDQQATDKVVTKVVDQTVYDKLVWARDHAQLIAPNAPVFTFNEIKAYPALGQYVVEYNPWTLISIYDHSAITATNPTIDFYTGHSSIIGTDENGVDIWTRTWSGTWSSIKLAFIVVVITTVIGVVIGGWVGMYAGSIIDIVVMKVISLYQSIPQLFWYILIAAMLPAGFWSLVIVFIITSWMASVGRTRIYMWKYVNSDFMKAAQTLGVSQWGRIFKHALPNFLGIILLTFVTSIPMIIESEASLGFLGLSPNRDGASLGNVLNEMQHTIATGTVDNTWYLLLPTLIIFTITMSLHFVAVGLSDAVDPKFRKA